MRGKFITILGTNNLGKSVQVKLLAERVEKEGLGKAKFVKYPFYEHKPLGPMLNAYAREGNPHNLSPREFQMLGVLHRWQVESDVRKDLDAGISVIAEDYVGTGIAWGLATGVSLEYSRAINEFLLKEDFTVLLDGERFLEAKEEGHAHESKDDLVKKVREIYKDLAKEYKWDIVHANDSIETVHKNIWNLVKRIF